MEATGQAALSAYRNLLRATRVAFKGDGHLIHAARMQASSGFRKGCSLQPASQEAAEAIRHAQDVAKILVQNIVQGQQVDGQEDRYKLNIHEMTEKGDNDTVKHPMKKGEVIKLSRACS